jgi:exosortase A-associated hydrolase 1
MREEPFFFDCEGAPLLGVLARPERSSGIGVVIVVGGPQYRVGSHRHFVLLARRLAAAGHPALRFDVRGMGDSDGSAPGFEASAPDVRAAVDALVARVPDLRAIVLWGLCDGATAAAFAAAGDGRVGGAVMLNPWIRTTAGESEAVVKHYYRQRLLSAGFWRKLAGGRFDLRRSLAEARMHWKRARGGAAAASTALPDRLGDAMLRAGVPALVLLAGRDATAAEFSLAGAKEGALRRWLGAPDVRVEAIAEADHTLSRASWRERADALTLDWIAARFQAAA